jgi:hypothetical protein
MFSARKARQHLKRKSGVPPQELFLVLQNIFRSHCLALFYKLN